MDRKTERQNKPGEPEAVMILATGNQIYMDMVREALEREGITVLLKSVTGYHNRGMIPMERGFFDYRLYVPREYEARAGQIVRTIVPPEEMQ